ncbi:MAG: hypothetical protein LBS63_04505 [Prevotellaceae bacterium]|jgi:hypothetical protein|nr:hypothetical protein [Prevotellaceae bacterium]
METLTAPKLFIDAMGELALDVRLMVLKVMPFLLVALFAWGYASFLFGVTQKLDFKKYLFTPLFLLLFVQLYPTAIDITSKAYGIIILTFERKGDKALFTEMMGVSEELKAYNGIAEGALDNQQTWLERENKRDENALDKATTPEEEAARKEKLKEIEKEIVNVKGLSANGAQLALFSIWDFFSIPSIRIIRFVIDQIRNVFLSLLVIFGCLAIFFEAIPAFKGILAKWFKFYTAVTFWALTICILDSVFLEFIKASVEMAKLYKENAQNLGTYNTSVTLPITAGAAMAGVDNTQSYATAVTDFGEKWYTYGGTQGVNKAMQVIMVLCYCMVPYITSLYIGGEQAGMFMSKVVGVGSMAARQALSTSTQVSSMAGRGVGSVAGGSAGGAVGGAVGKVAGLAGSAAAVSGAGNS